MNLNLNVAKLKVKILKISQKISKNNKPYNLITVVDLAGFEKTSFFLPEELIQDDLEGKEVYLEVGLRFKNWKPDLYIKGIAE